MLPLIRRNLKLFFRNRAGVFFFFVRSLNFFWTIYYFF